jgi:protein-tyrosine-phosphatase
MVSLFVRSEQASPPQGTRMNILFICSGNVSRSYLAEMLLRHEAAKRGLSDVSVSSAGLFAFPGNRADPHMAAYLKDKGIGSGPHEARQVTKREIDWADLILVMEKQQQEMIGEMWPEAERKVELLGKYSADGSIADDIVDPFGRSSYHYRVSQAQITRAIESLVNKLLSKS